MTTHFICPHCGDAASSELEVYEVDLGTGGPPAYFPIDDLKQGRERHIDTRLCCDACWKRHGKVPHALGELHPFGGRAHEARLASPVGTVIGAKPVHSK
ncbi:MAG TPA: hypothetical protein VFL83_21655 [Anaeromyxobacter sp.]|nr:hypothetical protein [Anaeromyxobacter sp.]